MEEGFDIVVENRTKHRIRVFFTDYKTYPVRVIPPNDKYMLSEEFKPEERTVRIVLYEDDE